MDEWPPVAKPVLIGRYRCQLPTPGRFGCPPGVRLNRSVAPIKVDWHESRAANTDQKGERKQRLKSRRPIEIGFELRNNQDLQAVIRIGLQRAGVMRVLDTYSPPDTTVP